MKRDCQKTVKLMEGNQKESCFYSTQKQKWKQLKRDEKRNALEILPS